MNTTTPPSLPADNLRPVRADVAPRFPILLVFIVWLAIVFMATLVTFILPEYFSSTARIKVGSDGPDIPSEQAGGTNAFDPNFLQTELITIQSEVVLTRVIDKLNLNASWGRKFFDGGKLKTAESLMFLRRRLDIRPVPNTSLVDIRAFSENPNEAQVIANEVVEAYQAWRHEQFYNRGKAGLKTLGERARELDAKIRWTKQLLTEPGAGVNGTRNPTHVDIQKQLEELTEFRSDLNRRIQLEEINLHLPRSGQVMILERAIASVKPFRPNKPLNIILGIAFGALAGFFLALLVYVIQRWAYRRRSGDSGTNNLRGLRTFIQVTVAILVGTLVGYNCAMPFSPASLIFMFLFIIPGGLVIGYVSIAKTTPLPAKADGLQMSV